MKLHIENSLKGGAVKCYARMLWICAVSAAGCIVYGESQPTTTVKDQQDDVKTLGGDQIEDEQIWEKIGDVKRAELGVFVQQLKGREVTFEDVPIVGSGEMVQDGSVVVKLGHPGERGVSYAGYTEWRPWMRVRFGKEFAELAELDVRERLTSVKLRFTGTVEGRLGIDCMGIACTIPPPEDPFAGGTSARITGDELLKMLDAHKDKLTMRQRLELIIRLHGRRLTFTCRAGCVETGVGGAAKLQAWVGAGVRLRFDMNPPAPLSGPNEVHRITGTADAWNLEGSLNLGALSFHDAVLED